MAGEPIGVLLRIARTRQLMTIRELSNRTGISDSTLYKYETGLVEPSFKNVAIIAKELRLNLNELGDLSK